MNKGFILFNSLVIYFLVLLMLNYQLNLLLLNSEVLKQHQIQSDCLALQARIIDKIEHDLRKYKEKDFKDHQGIADVEVRYDDIIVYLTIAAPCAVNIKLEYDDFSLGFIDFTYY